ncbi:MAG TPA: DUF2950 domain-containing protein [Bryobacteraceae bacterium]|nr:DUF2950 domain-containing protein [Bryobacteraceae bacterium]
MRVRTIAVRFCFLTCLVCGGIGYFAGWPLTAQSKAVQQGFATPQAAADALVQAAQDYDVPALKRILGPGSEDLVAPTDAVQNRNRAREFASKAREQESVDVDPKNPSRATLTIGTDGWPFPIPIVMRGDKWYFDTKSGRQEILMRRIGQNELDAIAVARGFVDAQKEYAETSEGHQYAQHIISTPGKKDGLYWTNPDGSPGGPLATVIAKALQEGYSVTKPTPYHGYYFKILKGQGPAARLGQLDFVTHGLMIGGFALAAAPAEYRVTGVKTFIVSHDGVVYQKDLGPNTLKIFQAMDRYNPDKTWRETDDEWSPR